MLHITIIADKLFSAFAELLVAFSLIPDCFVFVFFNIVFCTFFNLSGLLEAIAAAAGW